MAATRRRPNGQEVRQKPRGKKRLSGFHNGRIDGRRWLAAVRRLPETRREGEAG